MPEFSFTRYVEDGDSSGGADGGLVDAEGGGIVHFLVDYTVPQSRLDAAREALRDISQDATLVGPIVFESGRFALVSSFDTDDGEATDLTRQVVGVGRAPLIEGLKAAVSIHLTKKGSQILWRSFQMDTPDVSLVFEMTFSGLSDPAQATITADWDKLHATADKTLGAKLSYMGIGGGFDYQDFWSTALSDGALSIDYQGDVDDLQGLIDRAYARLHDMMFEPIPIEEAVQSEDDDSLQSLLAVANISDGQRRGSGFNMPWEAKINGGFKRRKVSRRGTLRARFSSASSCLADDSYGWQHRQFARSVRQRPGRLSDHQHLKRSRV